MKYIVDIVVDKQRDEVVAIFDDSEKLKEWMEGLLSLDHIRGEPGEVGAKSKLVFKMGNSDIEMLETITVKNLPEEVGATYEADGVFNTILNRFCEDGVRQTRMTQECEFVFTSFMMKCMGFFVPGMFKKQSKKNLESFKAFAEGQ
jgi:hypothetical protein